jgi:hypothetical protein
MAEDQKDLDHTLAVAQLEKLTLEIENIRQSRKLGTRLAVYIPVITTFIAVAGLVISVVQVQRAHTKDIEEREKTRIEESKNRINRIQSQMRTDKEQLLDFLTNEKISINRVSFLLKDLNTLIEQLPEPGNERTDVAVLLDRIVEELRFDDPRLVSFDRVALTWPEYSKYHLQDRNYDILVDKYYPMLRSIVQKDGRCILKTATEQGMLGGGLPETAVDKCQMRLLVVLLDGIDAHLDLERGVPDAERRERRLDLAAEHFRRYVTSHAPPKLAEAMTEYLELDRLN